MPMLIFAREQGEDATLALPGPQEMWFRLLSFNRKEGFYFHTNQGRGLKNRTHSRWERVLLRSSLPDAGCPPTSPCSGAGTSLSLECQATSCSALEPASGLGSVSESCLCRVRRNSEPPEPCSLVLLLSRAQQGSLLIVATALELDGDPGPASGLGETAH